MSATAPILHAVPQTVRRDDDQPMVGAWAPLNERRNTLLIIEACMLPLSIALGALGAFLAYNGMVTAAMGVNLALLFGVSVLNIAARQDG